MADHFRLGQLVLLYAVAGKCKTFLVLDWLFRIATGSDYLGRFPVRQGPAVHIYSEGCSSLQKRCDAWLDANEVGDRPDNVAFLPYAYRLADGDDVSEIIETVEDGLGVPSLVIVDTLARNFGGGDENSSQSMGAFVRNLDELRERWGCTVVVVHHSGWDGNGKPRRERGSSVLRGAADAVFSITGNDDEISIHHEKSKDDQLLPTYKLKRRIVDLGSDASGGRRTSLVLVPSESAITQKAESLPSRDDVIRSDIREIVRSTPGINSTAIVNTIRADWQTKHPEHVMPGNGAVRSILGSMNGDGIEASKGPNNADVWRSVSLSAR